MLKNVSIDDLKPASDREAFATVERKKQKETELKRVIYIADQVKNQKLNLTELHEDWVLITNILAHFGEAVRPVYHTLAEQGPEYNVDQVNADLDKAIAETKIKSPVKFWQMAANYGLQTKLPKTIAEHKREKVVEDIIGDVHATADYMQYAIWESGGMYWSLDGKNEKYCISNFVMRILYFVASAGDDAFRMIEIKNVFNFTQTLQLSTDDFEAVGTFKKAVARKGNFLWKGNDVDLVRLKDKLQRDERHTIIIQQLGWNKKYKFYAWANGVFVAETNTFIPTDEYGIVDLTIPDEDGKKKEVSLFIPALSKIYMDKDDMFADEKKFVYKKSTFTFQDWSKQYCLVYGGPGQMAMVYFVMAIFSDIIFKGMGGRFPLLNPYGKRGTGKGAIVESLMRLFGEKQDSVGLGGTSTSIGFLRRLAQLINAIVHLDEYKNTIDKRKIETLKEVYDRRPQTRGSKTMGFETNSVPVNSAAILTGQEMPTAEPALFTRVILLLLTETKFSKEQVAEFDKLQRMEEAGISSVTVELLKHRPKFAAQWRDIYTAEKNRFKDDAANKEVDERMVNNYSALVATAELIGSLEEIPFNVIAFREMCKRKLLDQHFVLKGSDDTSKFWQIVEGLFTKGIIKEGVHFKLEAGKIRIRIQDIYQDYVETFSKRKDANVLDKPTLEKYLESDTDAYVGRQKRMFSNGQKWCMVFNYEKLGIDLINEENEVKLKAKYAEMGMEYHTDDEQSIGTQAELGTEVKMDELTIKQSNGGEWTVPMLRIKMGLFAKESYLIIGADVSGLKLSSRADEVKEQRLGKLSDLHRSLKLELTEMMIKGRWPTPDYPDPDVVMMTLDN